VYRPPQKKVVIRYHLLADETADVILHALARGKQDMMDAFLQKEHGMGIFFDMFIPVHFE